MKKHVSSLLGLLIVASFVLVACGGGGAQQTGPVTVRWFVGLGTGSNPEQQEVQNQVVADFNAAHEGEIELVIEVADSTTAEQTLQTEIAGGDPPDIVGPLGIRGGNAFAGLWLDLEPLVEDADFDLSVFPEGAVEFYRDADGLTALPFGAYPSVIFYNRDLFDEAGLNYPPHAVGEAYVWPDGTESEWNTDTLRDLAMQLTVDAAGVDATSADFDPENIVQFGYNEQFTEFSVRAEWTTFGAGTFLGDDGTTAVLPDNWREAANWFYDGIWVDHFIPTNAYIGSDLLAAGNPFDSGNMAMSHSHLWYTCCNTNVTNWDVAVMPAANGVITAKLHVDTFRVLASTENPAAAFEVLTYLLASDDLLLQYGSMPSATAKQAAFFETLDARYAQGVDWDVFTAMLAYGDNPSHESNMPNFIQAYDREKALGNQFYAEEGLDVEAALDTFLSDLQAIFDAAD